MGMTLKELLTKGEGTLSAQEAKDLAAQCRMDEETLYTLLEERGIKVLEEDAEPTLDVEMLAKSVGLSRVHLYRKLKALTNLSTRDFIRNIRIQQAAKLLQDKRMNISDIAYSVGFNNLAHFSNSFKEQFGISPKEYMQKYGKTL